MTVDRADGRAVMRIESYGGGTQSTALIHMALDGVLPKLDAVIFADTRNEMPATYEHLTYIKSRCESFGLPFITVSKGNLVDDILSQKWPPTLPAHAINEDGKHSRVNGYTCSFDYKRRIVTAAAKRLCGKPGAWKRSNVEQWIGYTTDETSRCKQPDECRCGHKRAPTISKQSGRERGHDGACRECKCQRYDPWLINRFPLIQDLQMTRGDAARWITAHGYPLPPRSACFHCPNRGNTHWRDLKANHPDLWDRAVLVDQHQMSKIGDSPKLRLLGKYLHGSMQPLATADLRSSAALKSADGQDSLFSELDAAMDCDLGTCHT